MPKTIRKLVQKKPQAVADLESAMIRIVHGEQGISRVELARRLKLVPSTAGTYVDRLIKAGFLRETSAPTRGLGRPPIVLQLNPQAGRFVGVDFDARQVQATSVDFAQQSLKQTRRTIPARANVERVLEILGDTIEEIVGSRPRDLLGIGLGVPGPVDPARGVSLRYAFLPNWHDVPVGPRIAARFGAPVHVENNLRSMALAELWSGQGRGLKNLVCVGVRSGIGSGIIVDGRLLQGSNNLAGEIGRWIAPQGSLAAMTGSRSIEDVASLTALLDAADLATVADLFAGLERGERRIFRLVQEAATVHAWVVHQLASLFDPQRIVVCGPLVDHSAYLEPLRAAVERFGGAHLAKILTPSTLGPHAGAIGAAALAFQHWKPSRKQVK